MGRYGKNRRKEKRPKRARRANKITGDIDHKKREEARQKWGKVKRDAK